MNNAALVLQRRVKSLGQGALHCREIELRLADDGRHVQLSRYVERYRHDEVRASVIQHYRVPLASLIRWMIDNGERGSRE